MAALDFPASPTNGQIFVGTNGVTYQYNSTYTAWVTIGAMSSIIFVSDTPPTSPPDNSLWFKSDVGVLYVRYNDGNSSQWVPASPVPQQYPQTGWRSIAVFNPTSPQATCDFTVIPPDINFLECDFDLMPTTDNVNLWLQMFNASGVLDTGGNYPWSSTIHYSSDANANYANLIAASNAVYGSTGMALGYPASGGACSANAAQGGISGTFKMYNFRNTSRGKHVTWQSSHIASNLNYNTNTSGSGSRNIAGAITGVRLSFGSGNIAAGSYAELWGSP